MRTTLTETELAARWSVSPKTLQRWRALQLGPEYLKIGMKIQYTLAAIENYENPARPMRIAEIVEFLLSANGPDRQ